MPHIVSLGNELVRINKSTNRIEYSVSGGRTWLTRYSGFYCGEFLDLLFFDGVLFACSNRGVYASSNKGYTWVAKCTNSIAKTIIELQDGGDEILAITDDGHLYASRSGGATWLRRR